MDSTNSSEDSLELVEFEEQDELSKLILTLSTKKQRFVHLYTTGQYTLQQLAQLLEVHPNTLGGWLRNADVRRVIENMQLSTHDMVSTQLKALTMKATGKLGRLIDSPIDGVALAAVKDVLDRSGHKSRQEIKVDKTITTVEQKLAELVNTTIVDGEYEVIDDE